MTRFQSDDSPDTHRFLGVVYALCAFAILLALIASTGCGPMLSAQSPAPPGRSARLDAVNGFWGLKSYRVELSEGVALALTCYEGGPCEKLVVTSDDPKIAEVHAASLGTLEPAGLVNQQTASAVVLVGKSTGTTKLHVHTRSGRKREVAVTIIAPPRPSPSAAVAR